MNTETTKTPQSIVTTKFIDVSIQTNDLIDLAIEMWRLEHKLNLILPTLPENQRVAINNSFKKLKRYLDKNDIEIIDYTNQKFNDGLNLDILAVENDPDISESIVKETKEPTIVYNGQVVRKGKVIVLAKNNDDTQKAQNEQ